MIRSCRPLSLFVAVLFCSACAADESTPSTPENSAGSGGSGGSSGNGASHSGASSGSAGVSGGSTGASAGAGGSSGSSGSASTTGGSAGSSGSSMAGQAGSAGSSQNPPTHPNFIFILGEARGWTSTSVLQDEEVTNSKSDIFQTPNLENLAAEGMTFSDFYAPSPRCMPSRASYFTGKSPAQLHMTFIPEGNKDGDIQGSVVPPITVTDLPTTNVTVGSMLKNVGYATAHFGKWHAGSTDPSQYGFDESDGPTSNKGPNGEEHPNPVEAFGTVNRGIDFMQRQVDSNTPFYLQISNYGGGDPIDSLPETYAAESERLAGEKPGDIADAAVIKDMDTGIGMLLAKLQDLGIAETTYVFFSADHGRAGTEANEPLALGKGTVSEGGIRVPLLIMGPGISKSTHSHIRATQVDLFPTIAELAHVPGSIPDGVEGGSLWPVLSAVGTTVTRPREEFVVHFPHYDKDPNGPGSAILLGQYKLIRYYETGTLRLFDLDTDFEETSDLSAAMPDKVLELEQRLDAYLAEINAQIPGHL